MRELETMLQSLKAGVSGPASEEKEILLKELERMTQERNKLDRKHLEAAE